MAKKRKLGSALGYFGASFGMGLGREWQRASKKDREGGFWNWMTGNKGKKEDAQKTLQADPNELQKSAPVENPQATNIPPVENIPAAPPVEIQSPDVQVNPIAPQAEVTPAETEQYAWPADPNDQQMAPETTTEVVAPEPAQAPPPEVAPEDYQASWAAY